MAKLYITELRAPFNNAPTAAPVCQLPAEAEQTVAIGAAALSAAFGQNTRMIRVVADAVCSVVVGTGLTAAAATVGNARIAANAPGEYFAVKPGDVLACITNT